MIISHEKSLRRAAKLPLACVALACSTIANPVWASPEHLQPLMASVSLSAARQNVATFSFTQTKPTAKGKTSFAGKLVPRSSVDFGLQLGFRQKSVLSIQGAGEKPLLLTLEVQDGVLRGRGGVTTPLPDALVNIQFISPAGETLFKESYYVRPNPVSYKGEEREALIARWSTLPPASAHELRLKIVSAGEDVEIWIDDRFVGRSRLSTPATLRLDLPEGGALGSVESRRVTANRDRFVPLGLRGYRRSDADAVALPFARGAQQQIGDVPFQVAASGDVVDVGMSRWLGEKVGPEDYADTQYSRSTFDRRPDNILLAVPTDDYSQAHILAAVDPDPNKTPVLTLAFTRFTNDSGDSGGRGDGVAYSSIRLERKNGKWPRGVRQVGTVKAKDAAGREKEMPLLQFAVPIRAGEIPDVIDETGIVRGRSTQYMDLELTKELHPIRTKNYSSFSLKPVGKPSAALVYGLTLERAPVKVRVLPRQTGHIFYNTENIGFDLDLENRAEKNFAGEVSWKLTDFYGKTVSGKRKITVPQQAGKTRFALNLSRPEFGWYQAELALSDSKGNAIWRQPTSLAVLAPDMRKAGLETPFGAWWFRAIHGGSDSIAEIAPLFRRMGFRHTNPGGREPNPDGSVLAQHGMSLSTLPYVRKGALEEALPILDKWVASNPNVGAAMIFHESGSGAGWTFPPEFIGKETPTMTEKQREKYDTEVQRGIEYARYIREKYPHLKLIVGNGPMPFISGLMQNGYPKELVDFWGDEEVGQANIPEAPPTSSQSDFFWIKEYDRKYGYGKPVTSAYEWRGRGTNPGNLTELQQAQYYTRDVLKALAYGAPHINPGLIHDVGDAYYYSRWGAGGFAHRYPLLTPKISYVAMAVLTQQLDQAQFQRVLDTDSPTLHALEFKQNGDYVYALWLPRGEKKVAVNFAGDGAPKIVDMNGRATNVSARNRRATIAVGESPIYLRSSAAIASLQSGATSIFGPRSTPVVAEPMNDVANWQIDSTPDTQLETAHFDFPRRVGNITVQSVADEEKKTVIELTLAPEPDAPWPFERYITLRPKRAVPLANGAESVGVWVKGNSSWSRVFFEIEDANGEKFFSIGAEDGGWSLGDWAGETAVNFDGWNYLSVEMPRKYSSGFYQPGQNNWRSSGGDGVVNYPVRISRVVVSMRDKIVRGDRPLAVSNRSIRLSGLSGN